MFIKHLFGLTEREGGRTPDVPGRTTAHPPRLAGLHTLQEVVVLRLLAGLLRPVEEVVLRDGDLEPLVVARPHVLARLVLQPDPREDEGVGEDVIEQRVVDDDSLGQIGIEIERTCCGLSHGFELHWISEGVTQPVVDHGHVRHPEGGVHHGLLESGVQREGFLLHTAENIWT